MEESKAVDVCNERIVKQKEVQMKIKFEIEITVAFASLALHALAHVVVLAYKGVLVDRRVVDEALPAIVTHSRSRLLKRLGIDS